MKQHGLFSDDNLPESKRSAEDDPTFPERVYRLVRLIPAGKVTTYGAIAAVLGDRRAARMVGWAMSNCPPDVADIAHRVVNRYGELTGGWAWGHPDVMKQLLLDEGVAFVDEYRVDLDAYMWMPPMEADVEVDDDPSNRE